ncbi:hypothetical protein LTR66_011535 [Elasticomyces elasticus]|nr:hypothetical protein LTR66_011535 [Elasticomyces elasticus]
MQYRLSSWLLLSSIVVFATLVAFFAFTPLSHNSSFPSNPIEKFGYSARKQNTWADLSEGEAADIYAFLHEEFADLNLTKHPKSGQENFISFIEVLRPNKTDALLYLADTANVPQRWARVALAQNVQDQALIVYYMVGPLPISSGSQALPLEYCFNSGRNYVPNPVGNYVRLQDFSLALAENISDITEALLGATANRANPDDPDGLLVVPRPVRVAGGDLVEWVQLYRPGMKSNARTILPQGIYAKLNTSSRDVGEWTVGGWYYNGVLYESIDSFRAAVQAPGFQKTPLNLDGPWTDTEDFVSSPPGRDMPPPVMVQPNGPRYRLDRKERHVSWMGFEFYLSTAQATGVGLFDIRFKGERVMYELGLQEAMAHYAGDDPTQGGLEFLDTFFGMGKLAFELVPGYDCPAYADYLSSTYHWMEQVHALPNSVCIFEYTSDHLLSRHTSQFAVTLSRNTYLTVRSVSTVGNYDYTIDYIFYLDGSIEVKVRASGFIFAAFYTNNPKKEEHKYGYRLHDAAGSSMHDHVINFKADLDVSGTANEFVRVAIEPMTTSYPWDRPEVDARNTMHLVEHPLVRETGLDWPKNSGEMYIVYDSEEENAWGERRGYRITPGTGMGTPPHLTILNSTTLGKSARWSERDMWVLRRKDTEPRSADPLNFLEPLDPLVDFERMADGESLAQEHFDGDLVLFFNLGAHHVPHSGDIPNTLMHTSASSVMFVPHNFHDRDPSRETVQGVRLELVGKNSGGFASEDAEDAAGDSRSRVSRRDGEKKRHKARYFGATYEEGVTLPLQALEPNLREYASSENGVTDLSLNGSVAGVWMRNGP